MDFHPGDLDDAEGFPETIWVWWDSCGEYMDTTHDPVEGRKWMASASNGCGYAAEYTIVSSMGDTR